MASTNRTDLLISVLEDAFAPLMKADPVAFRGKFRKMASDPHSFYRGSACLFYADVTEADDPFATEESGRIWIHGDLHVENFGTYLNADGRMVFDINDFDEAYLGPLHVGPAALRGLTGAGGLAEGPAGGRRAVADREIRPRLPRPGRRLPPERR